MVSWELLSECPCGKCCAVKCDAQGQECECDDKEIAVIAKNRNSDYGRDYGSAKGADKEFFMSHIIPPGHRFESCAPE